MAGGGFGVGAILDGKQSDEDDYFKILGCSENSTDEQINTEYKIRALQCHPDKHPGDQKALEQFQKLQEAKETLLDPEKRLKYDKWKQSEMCISYKQWLGMSSRCATTMHWAKPKDQTMIESFSDHRRKVAQQSFDADAGYSDSGTTKLSNPPQQSTSRGADPDQPYVWRPETTTSIYSKFRNYKI